VRDSPAPAWPFSTIILAAGASRRFGPGPPKALAPLGDGSVLDRIAAVVSSRGAAPIVLVVGARAEELRPRVPSTIDEVVPNPSWASGRTGSLQRGLAVVPRDRLVAVWPVDVPFVAVDTLDRLLEEAARESLAQWWTPTWNGRGGHPILLSGWAVQQVLGLSVDSPLNAAPFRTPVTECRVPVEDPGILDNVNTREEFTRAEAAWRRRGGT
jgi:nicotine blue oxidoreductase